MYQATNKIARTFDREGIKYTTNTLSSGSSYVSASFTGDNAKGVDVSFLSSDNDNDVSVRAFSVVKFSEAKIPAMILLANQLNNKYRFVKFTVDTDDQDLNVEYDFPEKTDDVGRTAVELFWRFAKIIDEAYPQMMKTLWS
ncbi:MAG: YbjN domain-containing protein [Christensenellales bacterium]|nr:YbjN domain-containing protein [Clostridium sp.]MDY2925494.1 YbjN domain-containing protein [Eubacteriales bacterium]MCI6816974.1 YbjN domain-containing protein [Clostridium sp.]MCI6987643.1 YbjN domain-containing protein [Clostridium sp.]MCI7012754.1 YbjN domain-containing protein [Clostridium sp.]